MWIEIFILNSESCDGNTEFLNTVFQCRTGFYLIAMKFISFRWGIRNLILFCFVSFVIEGFFYYLFLILRFLFVFADAFLKLSLKYFSEKLFYQKNLLEQFNSNLTWDYDTIYWNLLALSWMGSIEVVLLDMKYSIHALKVILLCLMFYRFLSRNHQLLWWI